MNLRHQFILLIVSLLVIPAFIMGMSFYIFSSTMYPSDPRVVADQLYKKLSETKSEEQLHDLFDGTDEPYTGIIIEREAMSVYGNIDNLNIENPTIIIDSKAHRLENGTELFMILGVSLINEDSVIFPAIFMFSSLIPLILFPLLIIRSINGSIQKLETATKKIAGGDLDFELSAKRTDRIGSLAQSMNDMRLQLKEEKDRRNRFYMGVSHDLMTPLAHISGFSEAILEGLSENEEMRDRYLKIIIDKADLMEKRIKQLLDYLQFTDQEFQNRLEQQEIVPFLRDFFTALKEEQSFHNRIVEWSIHIPEDINIPFNEMLLNRALENLLQNSFRYGITGEAVRVNVRLENAEIRITVTNMGNPIPEEDLPYIFEPFYRVDRTRKNKGFGLGLSAVRSIIDSHGWNISVKSNEKGTEFCIVIPYV